MCLEDTVRIPLRAKDGSVRAYALIDAADADWVNQWTWRLSATGYAKRNMQVGVRSVTILLHRALLRLPEQSDGRTVDHINRDRLDDRRTNLRIATFQENHQNLGSYRGGTSRHRGVHWDTHKRKWIATIALGGRQTRLGQFDDEDEAASIAKEARLRLMTHTVE